jgi:hypothetical protein
VSQLGLIIITVYVCWLIVLVLVGTSCTPDLWWSPYHLLKKCYHKSKVIPIGEHNSRSDDWLGIIGWNCSNGETMQCDAINHHVLVSHQKSNALHWYRIEKVMHCIGIVSESDANRCHQIIVHRLANAILMHCIEESDASDVIRGPALLLRCDAIKARYDVIPMHALHQLHRWL